MCVRVTPWHRARPSATRGNGVLAESDAEPHLHLEIWKDGRPVDPIAVFLGVDSGDTM